MSQELISALFDRWAGKPILVIGGGPSVLDDLPKIDFEPACVISANVHGDHQSRFKLDLLVNCDKKHCFLHCHMNDLLRPIAHKHGASIVNAYSWADFRLGDMTYKGNTGLTAIFLAAALGGHPVVPLGIDFFHGGHVYFHEPGEGKKPKRPWQMNLLAKRGVKPLVEACEGAAIRPLSGPLTQFFPQYDAAETLPTRQDTPYRQHMAQQRTVYLNAQRPFSFGNWDHVRAGTRLALTPKEARDPRIQAGY